MSERVCGTEGRRFKSSQPDPRGSLRRQGSSPFSALVPVGSRSKVPAKCPQGENPNCSRGLAETGLEGIGQFVVEGGEQVAVDVHRHRDRRVTESFHYCSRMCA